MSDKEKIERLERALRSLIIWIAQSSVGVISPNDAGLHRLFSSCTV